mgnify:FL=1
MDKKTVDGQIYLENPNSAKNVNSIDIDGYNFRANSLYLTQS